MQLKTILVPFDFSDYAERAFSWAVEIAKDWDAKIILLHALSPIPPVATADAMSLGTLAQVDIPKMEAEMIEDTLQRLKKVAEQQTVFPGESEQKVIMSDPFWGICRTAEEEHSDLIVMGSHGRTGLSHVFLGSVAERVVRHATCPVLVVRAPIRLRDSLRTNISRSIAIGKVLRIRDDEYEVEGENLSIELEPKDKAKLDYEVVMVGDLKPKKKTRQFRNGTRVVDSVTYGLVNVRTDGTNILCATLNEKKDKWEIEKFRSRF